MNPVQIVGNLRESYIRYIESTIPIRDSCNELGQHFHEYLSKDGSLFKGPYMEFALPQRTGASIAQLVQEGVLHPRFAQLDQEALPQDRSLYLHQEQAVRRVSNGNNLLVSAGTGAGKTECFLLPVLDDIMRDQTGGVRAVLIYPLNALVQDQMDRLSEWFNGGELTEPVPGVMEWEFDGWSVRLAQYTGSTLRDDAEGDARTWFRNNCETKPTILVTNFCMLNWMLLRPEDDNVFSSGLWKYIVLDEAHVYQGTQGSEIRYLLSRLKHRLGKEPGEVRCVASSATVARDAESLAAFGAELFGESFANPDGVVFDERVPWGDFFGPPDYEMNEATLAQLLGRVALMGAGDPSLSTRIATAISAEFAGQPHAGDNALIGDIIHFFEDNQIALARRIQAAREIVNDVPPRIHRILWRLLLGNPILHRIGDIMEELRREDPNAGCIGIKDLLTRLGVPEVSSKGLFLLLDLAHSARDHVNSAPLFPARYHCFYRGTTRLFVELGYVDAGQGRVTGLTGNKSDAGPNGGRQYELYACRQCGQPFMVGYRHNQVGNTGNNVSYAWEIEPDTSYDPELPHAKRDYFALPGWVEGLDGCQERKLCLTCGRVTSPNSHCACDNPQGIVISRMIYAPNSKTRPAEQIAICPACDARTTMGDIVAPLRLSSNSTHTMVFEELLRFSPPDTAAHPDALSQGRKLLVFSDSRQGAASFASSMERSHQTTVVRRVIYDALAQGPVELLTLSGTVKRRLVDLGVYNSELQGPNAPAIRAVLDGNCDLGKYLSNEVPAQILAEFMGLTSPRRSLPRLGLADAEVSFDGVGEQAAALFNNLPGAVNMLTEPQARFVLSEVLGTVWRAKAVQFPAETVCCPQVDADAFGSNTAKCGIRLDPGHDYDKSWLPAQGRVNARLLILRKHLSIRGAVGPNDAILLSLLHELWDYCGRNGLLVGDASKQLPYGRLRFRRLRDAQACQCCGRHYEVGPISDVCRRPRCGGALVAEHGLDPESNHYQALIRRDLMPLRVEEDTAQLEAGHAQDYRGLFKEGRVNILSCSTTMELGVDLGSLNVVALRNVPPYVANYRQRAGRAGRRAGSVAFILSSCGEAARDAWYYDEPLRLLNGPVPIPVIHGATADVIAMRHVNAVLLHKFLEDQGANDWGRRGVFFVRQAPPSLWSHATAWRQNGLWWQGLKQSLRPNWGAVAIPDAQLDDFICRVSQCADAIWAKHAARRFRRAVLDALPALLGMPIPTAREIITTILNNDQQLAGLQAANAVWLNHILEEAYDAETQVEIRRRRLIARAGAVTRSLARLEDGIVAGTNRRFRPRVVDELVSCGVLPSFGFPTDVINLELPEAENENLDPNREMRIALTDYAPGRELVMDKKLVQCTSLVIEGDSPDLWLVRKCAACGRYNHRVVDGETPRPPEGRIAHWEALGGVDVCEACQNQFTSGAAGLFYMIRPDGFATIQDQPLKRARLRRTNEPQAFYVKVDQLGNNPAQEWDNGGALQREWYRNSQLLVVNEGSKAVSQHAGFPVCFRCWRGDCEVLENEHKPTWGGSNHAGPVYNVFLRAELPTDTLVFSFNNAPNTQDMDEYRWFTVGYALIEGAVRLYQIPRDHLDCAVMHHNGARRLVLFDNVPGGAAIVRRIAVGDIPALLATAYSVASECTGCAPDKSCPRCLQARGNPHMHDKMQRQWAVDFIEQVAISAHIILAVPEEQAFALPVAPRGMPPGRNPAFQRIDANDAIPGPLTALVHSDTGEYVVGQVSALQDGSFRCVPRNNNDGLVAIMVGRGAIVARLV